MAAGLEALPRGDGEETWHRSGFAQVDCLIVAHCPDGNPKGGDYLWIDVPKYTADSANVLVVFLSPTGLDMANDDNRESRLWETTYSLTEGDADGDQVVDIPVVFKKRASRGLQQRTGTVGPIPSMAQWFAVLDALYKRAPANSALAEGGTLTHHRRPSTRRGDESTHRERASSTALNAIAFPNMCEFQAQEMAQPGPRRRPMELKREHPCPDVSGPGSSPNVVLLAGRDLGIEFGLDEDLTSS